MRSPLQSLHPLAVGVLLFSACTAPQGEPEAVSLPSVSTALPRLEPRPLTISDADLPVGGIGPATVSDDGQVTFFHSFDDGPAFRIVDSTGARIGGFGRRGEGPGELRLPLGIRIVRDTIWILDNARAMLITYSRDGSYLDERRALAPGLPLAWDADSMDIWMPPRGPDGAAAPIQRVSRDGSGGRVLIAGDDSALMPITELARTRRVMVPPYTAHAGDLYIADPFAYRIHRFDANGQLLATFGRELPPRRRGPLELAEIRDGLVKAQRPAAGPDGKLVEGPDLRRRLDTLAEETVAHFNRAPLHVDAMGRLWVIGTASDSTSIDVFADTTLLGRLTVPCLLSAVGAPAVLADGWLLLQCRLPAAAERSWELQLYRVVDSRP